jgi:hypothetical protein
MAVSGQLHTPPVSPPLARPTTKQGRLLLSTVRIKLQRRVVVRRAPRIWNVWENVSVLFGPGIDSRCQLFSLQSSHNSDCAVLAPFMHTWRTRAMGRLAAHFNAEAWGVSPGQSMRSLWWKKWKWDWSFLRVVHFSAFVSFHQCSVLIHSSQSYIILAISSVVK